MSIILNLYIPYYIIYDDFLMTITDSTEIRESTYTKLFLFSCPITFKT